MSRKDWIRWPRERRIDAVDDAPEGRHDLVGIT